MHAEYVDLILCAGWNHLGSGVSHTIDYDGHLGSKECRHVMRDHHCFGHNGSDVHSHWFIAGSRHHIDSDRESGRVRHDALRFSRVILLPVKPGGRGRGIGEVPALPRPTRVENV